MDSRTFDKAKWSAEGKKSIRNNERWRQTEAFLEIAKPGTTRQRILDEVGPPDATEHENRKHTDLYLIGIPPYGIDAMTYNLEYEDEILKEIYFTRE